jgi:protein-tyrosine-phosphatase
MAHGLLRELEPRHFDVYSAGVRVPPGTKVNPNAVQTLARYGIDISDHTPVPCERCHLASYPPLMYDYVFSLCELDTNCRAIGPETAHVRWHIPEPTAATDDSTDTFDETTRRLKTRLEQFVSRFENLDWRQLPRSEREADLERIHKELLASEAEPAHQRAKRRPSHAAIGGAVLLGGLAGGLFGPTAALAGVIAGSVAGEIVGRRFDGGRASETGNA